MNMMNILQRVRTIFKRLWSFFRGLQGKLTLVYALFTIVTILILGGAGLGFFWYINFHSNMLPTAISSSLERATPQLVPYLQPDPPDREGLQAWLKNVTPGNNLVIAIPREGSEADGETIAAQFGRVILVAVGDEEGRVLAAIPPDMAAPGADLQAELSSLAAEKVSLALTGTAEAAMLAARDADGHTVAAAPIRGAEEQVLGVIFIKVAFPVERSEFLWGVLQGLILPGGLVMLVMGVIMGVIFGFLIARGLTRRLDTLEAAADAWSQGDFSVLVDEASGDELGQLGRHLNRMALELQNLLQTHQELATMEERNRLARELHDSVKQQVFATAMQVGAARSLLKQDPQAAGSHLAEADSLVRQAQQELTTLIRELRPATLEGKGLVAALREYVADWSRQTNIKAEVRVQGERALPLRLEQALFRIAQEALANIARHSQATEARLHLNYHRHEVSLAIQDNGRGFNPAAVEQEDGLGLRSMRERVEMLNGQLEVTGQPGRGTQVAVYLNTRDHPTTRPFSQEH